MKISTKMFWVLTAFFLASSALYTVWSLLDPFHRRVEWAGTIALGLCGVLFALIAFYLGRVHSAQGGELPEDRVDADIDDGDPETGFFSPWSWWPVTLAASLGFVFLGLAIGVWIAFIGVALTLVSLVGWIYEYYRGSFAR